jgi:hypothetical protein
VTGKFTADSKPPKSKRRRRSAIKAKASDDVTITIPTAQLAKLAAVLMAAGLTIKAGRIIYNKLTAPSAIEPQPTNVNPKWNELRGLKANIRLFKTRLEKIAFALQSILDVQMNENLTRARTNIVAILGDINTDVKNKCDADKTECKAFVASIEQGIENNVFGPMELFVTNDDNLTVFGIHEQGDRAHKELFHKWQGSRDGISAKLVLLENALTTFAGALEKERLLSAGMGADVGTVSTA